MSIYKHLVIMTTAAMSLCGCGYLSGAAESVSDAYKTYIDPPASVNYANLGNVDESQKILGCRLNGVDRALTALERTMIASDKPPTEESVNGIFAKYPWISGLVAVDKNGEILARRPEFVLKELDFSSLVAMRGATVTDRKLAGQVQDTPLGAEFLLGSPVFFNADYLGMVIVHFDIRSILNMSENPDDLIIMTPDSVLWPGRYDVAATPLTAVRWKEVLESDISGVLKNDRGSFIWIVRYIGEVPIIFATQEPGRD